MAGIMLIYSFARLNALVAAFELRNTCSRRVRTPEGHNQDPLPTDARDKHPTLTPWVFCTSQQYPPYFSPRPPCPRSDPSVGQSYILGWPSRPRPLIPTKGPFQGERYLERSHTATRIACPERKSERLEGRCERLAERRTKREIEENSWEARKASRVEKRGVVEVRIRNPTRGEPASEAIANAVQGDLILVPPQIAQSVSASVVGPKRGN